MIGALSLHVRRKDFFDDAVIGLLDAMAADLSFALDNLDREAERRDAVSAAKAGLEHFQKIFHATPVATVISTLDEGQLVDVNDAYCALVGQPRDELIGRTSQEIDLWLTPDARPAFVERIVRDRRVKEQEMAVRVRNGEVRDVSMSAELIEFGGRTCVLAIMNDVTERKRYESRIEFLATHDALTALPNRNLMLDRVTQALQHARRTGTKVALVYVDLDRFKIVNEALGTQGGDRVLAEVAARLRRGVRDGDTVARFGADEFVALVPDLEKLSDCYSLVAAAARVGRRAARGATARRCSCAPAWASACSRPTARTPSRCCATPRRRCCARSAPRRGGCQFFTPEMSAELRQRSPSSRRSCRARSRPSSCASSTSRRSSSRPARSPASRRCCAGTHPSLGAVPPASSSRSPRKPARSCRSARGCCERACAQNRRGRRRACPRCRSSVNVSARQFLQPDLVERRRGALDDTGMPGHLLELEITESGDHATTPSAMLEHLTRCAGSACASRSTTSAPATRTSRYLKRFPVDRLKIDQSFVRDLDTDPGDAAIVARGHRARPQPAARGDGRGRRERRAVRVHARQHVRRDPGLLLQPAGARRRVRAHGARRTAAALSAARRAPTRLPHAPRSACRRA